MNFQSRKIKDQIQKIRESLRKKTEGREAFIKVLTIAICVNLGLVAFYAALAVSVKDISITVNGKTAQIKTVSNSFNDLLRTWRVELDERDKVSVDKDAWIKDGEEIEIRTFEVKNETVKEEVKFKEKTEYSSDLIEGEKKISQKGVNGIDEVRYRVTYLGGEEQQRKEIARKTLNKPVTQITLEGTAFSYNGVKYSRKLTVSSTAYCLRGRTATGAYVHKGTIAVDPRVIPLGSYGYVPGYGPVHAEDTGGAIKGHIIDLWFPSNGQCRSWGRRTVEIYLK